MLLAACDRGSGGTCTDVLDAAFPGDAGAADAGAADAGSFCARCEDPSACGTTQSTSVRGVAGIVQSAVHERAFYVCSGAFTEARFSAIDEGGGDLGSYSVASVANVGWEDIAVGPCPAGSCVYIADIGDQNGFRPVYAIHRIAEPSALEAGDHPVTAESLLFTYPDGGHDARALLVHPTTGVITVITRDPSGNGAAGIYEIPSAFGGAPVTAMLKHQIAGGVGGGIGSGVTAGDVRADGKAILLRTRDGALEYPLKAKQSVADAIALGSPCAAPTAAESDGQAIAWLRSGAGYVTIDRSGSGALSYVICGR